MKVEKFEVQVPEQFDKRLTNSKILLNMLQKPSLNTRALISMPSAVLGNFDAIYCGSRNILFRLIFGVVTYCKEIKFAANLVVQDEQAPCLQFMFS